jgi:transposase
VIVIGADSHKRSHTVVGVDQVGRRLGERTVATTSDGHLALLEWSAQWPEVTFALEDCRHLTRRLEQDLLAAGQRVVRVPTRLMAAARRAGRQPGKSDPPCATPTCRSRSWTGRPGRSSCWSTTAVT